MVLGRRPEGEDDPRQVQHDGAYGLAQQQQQQQQQQQVQQVQRHDDLRHGHHDDHDDHGNDALAHDDIAHDDGERNAEDDRVQTAQNEEAIGGEDGGRPPGRRRRPPRKGALCELPGCGKRASFGDEMKKYRWCAQHRLPGSHSYQSHICEEPTCRTHASYTLDGIKKRWCAAHKAPGAFIKSATLCEADTCNKQATFGPPGGRRRWCSQHKSEGAVNLSKRTCSEPSCSTRAVLVHVPTRRKFCSSHAPENCREVKSRGQKSMLELKDQLAYVEAENNLLRARLKRLRAMCGPDLTREFDRRERQRADRPVALAAMDLGPQDDLPLEYPAARLSTPVISEGESSAVTAAAAAAILASAPRRATSPHTLREGNVGDAGARAQSSLQEQQELEHDLQAQDPSALPSLPQPLQDSRQPAPTPHALAYDERFCT